MRVFLILGGYIIIPLFLAAIFRLGKINWVFITYFLAAIFIFFYPTLQYNVECYYKPESTNLQCGTGSGFVQLFNNTVGLGATLMFQALFNYLFTNTFLIRKRPFK